MVCPQKLFRQPCVGKILYTGVLLQWAFKVFETLQVAILHTAPQLVCMFSPESRDDTKKLTRREKEKIHWLFGLVV